MNEFFRRYRIESRCNNYKPIQKSWLVIYDTQKQDYVKEKGSKQKFKRFQNSDEIMKWYDEEAENEYERVY